MASKNKGRKEQQCRIAAVERFENGEDPRAIWTSLGRSRTWLYKWVSRYREDDAQWFEEASRRPRQCPSRTPREIEEIVKLVRLDLYNKGQFCGAQAIIWEMEELEVAPLPSIRTVNRILARNELTNKRTGRYESKGRKYPVLSAPHANDVHQMDFVGPCYLHGPVRFYSLHSIDLASRRCAVEPAPEGKNGIVDFVWKIWWRLGLPRFLQVDNEMVFYGSLRYPRAMGKLIRLCLLNGVEPVFIPPGEPWRNGIVEKFNDHWQQKFLHKQTIRDAEELKVKSLAFEARHNTHWRYSALGGKSPLEHLRMGGVRLRFPRRRQPPQTPLRKPERGRYHLVRFIRSDGLLDIFGEKFLLPPQAVYEYVKATVDVGQQHLTVYLDDQAIEEKEYRMR